VRYWQTTDIHWVRRSTGAGADHRPASARCWTMRKPKTRI